MDVEIKQLGTVAECTAAGITNWHVIAADGRKAVIAHPHNEDAREPDTWFLVQLVEKGSKPKKIASRDFNDAVKVAKKLLGVKEGRRR